MKRNAWMLAVLLSVVGCKKEESAPASIDSPRPISTMPTRPPPPDTAKPAAKLDCEKLVPASVREKHFAGQKMTQQPMCPGCPEECKFDSGTISADCRMAGSPNFVSQVTGQWEKAGFTKLDGIGRAAYTQMKGMQVVFIPKDHDCYVMVTMMDGDSVAIAKDVDANVSAAALGL